jgi:hypothetical protein
MQFPPNSQASKEPEGKKIEKVVTGAVRTRKPSLGKRFAEAFMGGADAKSIWQYVIFEVILPAAKDTLADAVSQSVERALFGEARSASRRTGNRPSGSTGYISYNRFSGSSSSPLSSRREDDRVSMRGQRGAHNLDDIILATKSEVSEVIDRMYDIVAKYDVITVADLYEMLGLAPSSIDHKWGWRDLRAVGSQRITNGYLLDLPKPEPLD